MVKAVITEIAGAAYAAGTMICVLETTFNNEVQR
jgi:hypothetical protein